MAKYQKYVEYKDSGCEWTDKLPVHWNSVHLKWISTIYAGGTPSKTIESYWENGTIPWINSGAVNQTYILEPSTYITQTAYENSSAKWIPQKALVMALAGQGKTKGMVAQLGINTTCNQSMGAIIPNDLGYARYLFWWITSNYQNIRNMAGGDLRDGLNLEHLGDMDCPLPNDEEIKKIANFLDHETTKIDTLIAKQEKLIELLREKRQAVIGHAVTKGLNSNLPMKDSGVEWAATLPINWSSVHLKWISTIYSGGTPSKTIESYWENGVIPWISSGAVNQTYVLEPSTYITKAAYENSSAKWISKNALVMALAGQGKTKGMVAQLGIDTTCNQSMAAILPNDLSYARFLFWWITANYQNIRNMSGGDLRDGLNLEHLGIISCPLPSREEATTIASFLDQKTAKIDILIAKQEKLISLMQERRTALISAAVTGKIDVRNWENPNQKNEANMELSA